MKRKLQMDDVRVGMYITIFKGLIESRTVHGPEGPMILSKEKQQYKGDVMEVLSVDMPYIVVALYAPAPSSYTRENDKYADIKEKRDVLDLRDIEVMLLTNDYILKLMPNFKINNDKYWDDMNLQIIDGLDFDINEIFKDL